MQRLARLKTLKASTQSATETSISERVAQLRKRSERRREEAAQALADAGGEEVAPGLWRFDSVQPGPLGLDAALAHTGWSAPVCGLDIETNGLSAGVGNLAFMVGVSLAVDEAVHVRQWLLASPSAEATMLSQLMAEIARHASLISYNGRSFDWPVLASRCRLNHVAMPVPAHWDLLLDVRRVYRQQWPDCRLQTAERELLGLARDNDLPSAEVPEAYRAYLGSGETTALLRALRHHRDDLVSLLRLPVPLLGGMQAAGLRILDRPTDCSRPIPAR